MTTTTPAPRLPKILIASVLGLALIAIAILFGLKNNTTTYDVVDRFQIVSKTAVTHPYLLWVKEQNTTGKSKDIYVSKKLWDTCWMGDKFTVRRFGTDKCERTAHSVEPTSERVKHDPTLAKKLEDSKKQLEQKR